jgi:IS6 family transposase
MRGMKTVHSVRIMAAGHAFVQNLRRGHCEIAIDQSKRDRLRVAFGQLATCV